MRSASTDTIPCGTCFDDAVCLRTVEVEVGVYCITDKFNEAAHKAECKNKQCNDDKMIAYIIRHTRKASRKQRLILQIDHVAHHCEDLLHNV